MKKILLTVSVALLAMASQAQIKIQQTGQVSLSTVSSSLSQGVQFTPTCTYFNSTSMDEWSWVTMSRPKRSNAKSWIVTDSISINHHVFSVTGKGHVYYTRLLSRSLDGGLAEARGRSSEGINGREALDIVRKISGFYYLPEETEIPDLEGNVFVSIDAIPNLLQDYTKRDVELSSLELSDVFPEAVRSDADGHRCIDYNAIVTILVEAVKEQQREIEELRTILEKTEKNKK